MNCNSEEILKKLIERISTIPEIKSAGISGSKSPLPKPGESDIDIFIYCDSIPPVQSRQSIFEDMSDYLDGSRIGVFEKGHWGLGDFTYIKGVETWLMYFTTEEAIAELDSVLNGDYLDKVDNYYYPIGRCAMLEKMTTLYERDGFLESVKRKLSVYPEKLAEKMVEYHLDKLNDREDMERAVSRKDVFYYHFAFDLALDHFLQAIFAMNRVYFPSRKRTMEYMDRFAIKPPECGKRLLEIIKKCGTPDEIQQSYSLWRTLTDDLVKLMA